MVKRLFAALLALLLIVPAALGELTVEKNEGEAYFPDEKSWVYHFTYAYPHIAGEDYTAALINDTYQMALDEMTHLVLPMFANAPDMRFDGRNEVVHDFSVMCNDGRLLSVLQRRSQTKGREGVLYALEPLTFDVSGVFAGETLTLRGVALVQAGVDPEELEEVLPQDYPEFSALIGGSSTSLSQALMPLLYLEFTALQDAGTVDQAWTEEDFYAECAPARDFYANDRGEIVFFLPPMLLSAPSFDVPSLAFTPAQLEDILRAADADGPQ